MVVPQTRLAAWVVQISKPGEIEQVSFGNEQEARAYAARHRGAAKEGVTVTITGPEGHSELQAKVASASGR